MGTLGTNGPAAKEQRGSSKSDSGLSTLPPTAHVVPKHLSSMVNPECLSGEI